MFQFPLNPTIGQAFTPIPGVVYRWNGTAWFLVGPIGNYEDLAILYAIALG
ncbi:MAG TPA: hypothetical protein VJ755_11790 [Gemmatimonadales bacterium]|nr:hypothetical protein [Gemmatimonadales bacterium]